MATSQTIFYRTGRSEKEVSLTVLIGEAQKGSTTVFLGDKVALASTAGSRVTVTLGVASSLKGRKCISTSVVTDVNPNTDRTTVTWTLEGGSTVVSKSTTETLDKPGDSILHAATIYFL